MKVIAYGESYECTKAEKGSNYIQLYNGEEKGVLFAGISDFSGYSIEGGEWSAPEMSERERIEELETLLAELLFGGEGE